MPDWKDPKEQQRDIEIFAKMVIFWLGLYTWEFLTSFTPDWEVLSGKRKFRVAQLVYFTCRYSTLALLIGVNIAMETKTSINCEALYVFNGLALGLTIGTSSLLLMLRTIVVWSFDKRVIILVCFFSFIHWGIILRDITVTHSSWNTEAGTCAVDRMYNVWLAIEFISTMAIDFIILCLTTWGLLVHLPLKSDVRDILIRDGLIYFICAFVANALPAITMLNHLNPVMDFMFTPFAAVVSCIVATRSVRRLTHILSGNQAEHSTARRATILHPPDRRSRAGNSNPSWLTLTTDSAVASLPSEPQKVQTPRSEKGNMPRIVIMSDHQPSIPMLADTPKSRTDPLSIESKAESPAPFPCPRNSCNEGMSSPSPGRSPPFTPVYLRTSPLDDARGLVLRSSLKLITAPSVLDDGGSDNEHETLTTNDQVELSNVDRPNRPCIQTTYMDAEKPVSPEVMV